MFYSFNVEVDSVNNVGKVTVVEFPGISSSFPLKPKTSIHPYCHGRDFAESLIENEILRLMNEDLFIPNPVPKVAPGSQPVMLSRDIEYRVIAHNAVLQTGSEDHMENFIANYGEFYDFTEPVSITSLDSLLRSLGLQLSLNVIQQSQTIELDIPINEEVLRSLNND